MSWAKLMSVQERCGTTYCAKSHLIVSAHSVNRNLRQVWRHGGLWPRGSGCSSPPRGGSPGRVSSWHGHSGPHQPIRCDKNQVSGNDVSAYFHSCNHAQTKSRQKFGFVILLFTVDMWLDWIDRMKDMQLICHLLLTRFLCSLHCYILVTEISWKFWLEMVET